MAAEGPAVPAQSRPTGPQPVRRPADPRSRDRTRGEKPDAVVLELKATRNGSYLGRGLSQLLGYLKERPALWTKQPSGWLVAPPSPAYEAAPAEDREAWILSAHSVAEAAVERFVALSAQPV